MKTQGERMPLLLFLVGAAATIILLVLFAYAPDLRGDMTNDSNAVSRSAIGFAGLKRLMELSGIPTEIDRGVTAGEKAPSLTILTPTVSTSATDWHDYDEHSTVLIILPKWIAIPMPLRPDWVMKAGAWPANDIQKMMRPVSRTGLGQAPGDFRGLVSVVEPPILGLPQKISGDI